MKKITIAIDGHSSCGKSTMAKDLARRINYIYIDTGAMYRTVTLYALRNGMIAADGTIDTERLQQQMDSIKISFAYNQATGRPDTYLNGECVEKEIRTIEVSSCVSPIAALPFVREQLVKQQQDMGREKGVVMDGRDIGTNVFPDAELKGKGMEADYDEIYKNVVERDYIDSHRETAPLRKAEDALVLDNSTMTIEEQNEWLYNQYQTRAM